MADKSEVHQVKDSPFPYELTRPSQKFTLPRYLDEISGISYKKHNQLVCIDDEKGEIYLFDIDRKKVTNRYQFGKGRDYEDIALVNNTVFVLQSNGDIWQLDDFQGENPEVKKCKTFLSARNDAEGLAFDGESNSLLMACKGSPHPKKKNPDLKEKKAIYRFDLNTHKLSPEPCYIIDLEDIADLKEHSSKIKFLSQLGRIFGVGEESDGTFQPSGVAVHPVTKDMYLISSSGKMLVVLDRKGEIKASRALDRKMFKQPEGICFHSEGDLFISNEGKGGRANILQFHYLREN
ncbi:MAG: SdiA-regulated domain-containing protein [bacterium]